VLCVPSVDDCFVLCSDASGHGIGGVLYLERENGRFPVAYFSKQLTGAEKNYSATELEALAVVRSMRHFAHWLWGKKFSVVTDHRPSKALLMSKTLSRLIRNWVLQLQDFDFEITHRPGKDNGELDALSRQDWNHPGWFLQKVNPCSI